MERRPPTLDMRLDGSFAAPPRAGLTLSTKLMIGTVLLAVTAGAIAVAAVAVWVLSMALPVLVIAGLGAWAMLRFRRWQAMRTVGAGRVVR